MRGGGAEIYIMIPLAHQGKVASCLKLFLTRDPRNGDLTSTVNPPSLWQIDILDSMLYILLREPFARDFFILSLLPLVVVSCCLPSCRAGQLVSPSWLVRYNTSSYSSPQLFVCTETEYHNVASGPNQYRRCSDREGHQHAWSRYSVRR